jgi:hypothetical protein
MSHNKAHPIFPSLPVIFDGVFMDSFLLRMRELGTALSLQPAHENQDNQQYRSDGQAAPPFAVGLRSAS